jgi:hypothetical protein
VKEGSVTRTVFNEAVAEVVRLLENNDFDRLAPLQCARRPSVVCTSRAFLFRVRLLSACSLVRFDRFKASSAYPLCRSILRTCTLSAEGRDALAKQVRWLVHLHCLHATRCLCSHALACFSRSLFASACVQVLSRQEEGREYTKTAQSVLPQQSRVSP